MDTRDASHTILAFKTNTLCVGFPYIMCWVSIVCWVSNTLCVGFLELGIGLKGVLDHIFIRLKVFHSEAAGGKKGLELLCCALPKTSSVALALPCLLLLPIHRPINSPAILFVHHLYHSDKVNFLSGTF